VHSYIIFRLPRKVVLPPAPARAEKRGRATWPSARSTSPTPAATRSCASRRRGDRHDTRYFLPPALTRRVKEVNELRRKANALPAARSVPRRCFLTFSFRLSGPFRERCGKRADPRNARRSGPRRRPPVTRARARRHEVHRRRLRTETHVTRCPQETHKNKTFQKKKRPPSLVAPGRVSSRISRGGFVSPSRARPGGAERGRGRGNRGGTRWSVSPTARRCPPERRSRARRTPAATVATPAGRQRRR